MLACFLLCLAVSTSALPFTPAPAQIVKTSDGKFYLKYKKGMKNSLPQSTLPRSRSLSGSISNLTDACTWGEWGQFEECSRVSKVKCKRIRIKEPTNPASCKRYRIEAEECECPVAKRLVSETTESNATGAKSNAAGAESNDYELNVEQQAAREDAKEKVKDSTSKKIIEAGARKDIEGKKRSDDSIKSLKTRTTIEENPDTQSTEDSIAFFNRKEVSRVAENFEVTEETEVVEEDVTLEATPATDASGRTDSADFDEETEGSTGEETLEESNDDNNSVEESLNNVDKKDIDTDKKTKGNSNPKEEQPSQGEEETGSMQYENSVDKKEDIKSKRGPKKVEARNREVEESNNPEGGEEEGKENDSFETAEESESEEEVSEEETLKSKEEDPSDEEPSDES